MPAFSYNSDEAFNAMRALLAFHGQDNVWTDQPPFLRILHVGLFHLFGPSITSMRSLELGFSGMLLTSLFLVLRRGRGAAALLALVLLVLSSGFFEFSVSCLIGMPAYALAMAACACLICGAASKPQIAFWLSGFLLGLGAQTKLSALLALPAIATWIWCLQITCGKCSWLRGRAFMHWFAGFAVAFIGVLLASSQGLMSIASAHWGEATRNAFAIYRPSYFIVGQMLLENRVLAVPALLGALVGLLKRRKEMLLPGVWLLTALGVHLWHRPFWNSHFMHLAVPMAWLAGIFIDEMIEQFKALTWEKLFAAGDCPPIQTILPAGSIRSNRAAAWLWLILPSFFAVAFIADAPSRWDKALAFTMMEDSKRWECVNVMKQYKERTKWVFADNPLYPFHAGMLTPPEIAVLSNKRLKAGLITQPELLNLLAHYRAEQVVLSRDTFDSSVIAFVRLQYSLVYKFNYLELYVRKDLIVDKEQKDTQQRVTAINGGPGLPTNLVSGRPTP